MSAKRRLRNQQYPPNVPVNNLVLGKPRNIGKRNPCRIFMILTGITTVIVGVWTTLTLVINGNINGRYAGYAGKDSAIYELNRSFDEEADSLEYAISILGEFNPRETYDGGDPPVGGKDDNDGKAGAEELWTPTRTNLSHFVAYERNLSQEGIDEPQLVVAHGEGGSSRYNLREYTFMHGTELLNLKDSYGYDISTGTTFEISGGKPTIHGDGLNRIRDRNFEDEYLYNFLPVNGDLFFAGFTYVWKYNYEEKKFDQDNRRAYDVSLLDLPETTIQRVSAKGDIIYIVRGDSANPGKITVYKFNTKTDEMSAPIELYNNGPDIDLYAGFVVDDRERLLFNSVLKNDKRYTASIVSCSMDGRFELCSEYGTLISSNKAFITLQQTDYGIAARSGDGILFYSFDTHSVTNVFDYNDSCVFKADGPYIYACPTYEIKINNSAGYISTYYEDKSNFCLKRANILTGSSEVIDLTVYYDEINKVSVLNLCNSLVKTDEKTSAATCTDNEYVKPEFLQEVFTKRFVASLNQNKCIFGYHNDLSNHRYPQDPHMLFAEIDDSGNVSCSTY